MNEQDVLAAVERMLADCRDVKVSANSSDIRAFLVSTLDDLDWMKAEVQRNKLPNGQSVWTATLVVDGSADVLLVCKDAEGELVLCEWFPTV